MATILIIDDDPTTLGLLRTRLEKSGYMVKEAKDGQEGVRTAERERPDLIFLDVRMPKVDGWQACRTLKSNPATSQCPVVILTGCSQDAQELYGLQCGADEYITKPWDSKHLMQVTSQLLSRSVESRDIRSEASQQRFKQYIQRVVRVMGSLPKTPNIELMAGQLLRLATSLIADYQTAIQEKAIADFRLKVAHVEHQAGELVYWLELLRDSKASDNPEIPMLLAEGSALHQSLTDASKTTRHP